MNQPFSPPVSATAAKARFTTREFVQMIDAGAFADMKVELVRGELERMPPQGGS
jgi:Uma2 family endonuclease